MYDQSWVCARSSVVLHGIACTGIIALSALKVTVSPPRSSEIESVLYTVRISLNVDVEDN